MPYRHPMASHTMTLRRRGARPPGRHPLTPLTRARGAFAASLLGLLLAGVGWAGDLHVALDGKDTNPGTRAKPFATLEAARDAIRKLKRADQYPERGLTVWVHGGAYARAQTFELGAEDSGQPRGPVVYRAVPGESVRLRGGQAIKGFTPVTDPAARARFDAPARAHVLEADLRGLGAAAFGRLRSRGFGRATVAAHSELFFAGQPMTLARWPNRGDWAKIAGYPQEQTDEHGGKLGPLEGGFVYEGDRPQRWRDPTDLWVHGYWAWDWANSYEHVERLDLGARLVKTAPPRGLYGFRKGQRFYFVNVLEELDEPGEWFLDVGAAKLYFWPPKDIAGGEALLSLLEGPLVRLREASHISLRGLVFEATRGPGISIHGGATNRVLGCALRLLGNAGVEIAGGAGHGVVGCDIEDTGDGGVLLSGGDRQTLAPGGHFVENCRFQRQGRWSRCYVPAVLVEGVGHRVAHNLIFDHPHCAILFGGNDHCIEFNEIHHIALETGDVGAIYAGRDYTIRGNAIRHNFIHHTGGVGMGSMGVYMDDCVSGTEITGNIFYRVTRAAFLGGGRDHVVQNNIFVDCTPAVQLDGRGLDKSPVWHGMVTDYMKKQLQAVPRELYRQRYPALTNLDPYYAAGQGIPPEGNVVSRNICVGGKWLEVGWHADPKLLETRDNLVGTDPRFVAPEKLDFRLAADSPALRLGFQPIPVEKIGLRDDEYRRELGRRKEASAP